jgi:hypothetical protein
VQAIVRKGGGKSEHPKLGSTCECPQKLLCRHPVLECFSSVDENYGNLFVVFLPQLGIAVDVDFAPQELAMLSQLRQLILHDIAEVTALARVDNNLMHSAIVDAL